MNIIGQKNLIASLNKFTIDTFPNSVLFIGEEGIGKHTFINYINETILGKLDLLDITQNICDEYINEIYCNPNPVCYVINLNNITEKEQNIILKFVEEPLKNAFIFLLCESKTIVLNTILNRCIHFEFEPYTEEELKYFITSETDTELILKTIRTPGKIINYNLSKIKDLYDLCSKIINLMQKASYPNTLSIADKINYKDDYDKYDINLFFDVLTKQLAEIYIQDNTFYDIYLFIIEEKKKLVDSRLNKNIFMQNFLSNLWILFKKKD